MRGHLVLFLAATVALTPRLTAAQDLAVGQRIRVRASGVAEHPVIGTIARYDSATLWLQRDSALDSIPLNTIRALERSDGFEKNPVAPMLLDVVYLGGLTAITYAGSQAHGCNSTAAHIGCGILGFFFGGYLFTEVIDHYWPEHKVEEWVKVPTRSVSLRPVFSHGVGLALVLSF
jgi:hypothetical protein